VFVAQPKRCDRRGFLLEAGKSDPIAFALTGSELRPGRQRAAAVHGGFLEHLLAHLGAPRQPGHPHIGDTIGVDDEYRPASSVFFHALNALIKSNPLHGTSTSGLAFQAVSAVFHPQN
jgi:hypothetical protein